MVRATKYPDQQIDVKRVAKELEMEEKAVRDSLEKLRWIDVVKKSGLISYSGPNDPMMRRYIEYQHLVEMNSQRAGNRSAPLRCQKSKSPTFIKK